MSLLARSQALFFAGLMPQAAPQTRADAAGLLDASPDFVASSRLQVYRDMYVLRLTEALRIDFEQVHTCLGPTDFSAVALAYITAHPPHTPSLNDVGRHFPDFLQKIAHLRADLSDLARLEWARMLAAQKPGSEPVLFTDWLALGPALGAATRFRLSPSLSIVETQYATCLLWRALEHGTERPEPQKVVSFTAVWRERASVAHKPLQAQDAHALAVLSSGGDFTALCALFTDEPNPAERVAQRMQQFFAAGFITGFGGQIT